MKEQKRKNLIYLHIAVMLFGLAGAAGQFVEVPAVMVALGRVVCSSLLLFVLAIVKKDNLRLASGKDYGLIVLTGIILAVHWTTFFQSIQVSSVAIGTITFSTFPLFVTFLEPVVFREKLQKKSVFCAILLLVGVIITIPEFSAENQVTVGVAWGMVCSLSYAVMTLFNRYFSEKYESRVICLYEQGTAAVVLLPALLLVDTVWRAQDIAGVAFIGFVCTAFAHSLYVSAQRWVRAQTAGIISGMETVYGIVFAFMLLGEVPDMRELAGGAVILGTVFYSSLGAGDREEDESL